MEEVGVGGESPGTKQRAQPDGGRGITDQHVQAWSENRAHADTTDVSREGGCEDGSKVHADGVPWTHLNAARR